MKVRVKIPSEKDPRFKSWAKSVDFVDDRHSNAYAFEGEWLQRGQQYDLTPGTVVLLYDETGTRQKTVSRAEVHVVSDNDLYGPLIMASGVDWVMQIRDEVAELLDQEPPPPDLSDVNTEYLIQELLKRVDTTNTNYDFRKLEQTAEVCSDCNCVRIKQIT